METIMKADIFFFVTTVAVTVFIIFFVLLSIQLMRFFNLCNRILKQIESTAGELSQDAKEMIEEIRESFIFRLLFFKRSKAKRKK